MKRLLMIVLSGLLVGILSTAAMAAVVTTQGDIRTWAMYSTDGKQSLTDFFFDRYILSLNVEQDKTLGLKTRTEFRSYGNGVTNDIRSEAYFYKKGLFLPDDQIQMGTFGLSVYMPFRNSGFDPSIVTLPVGSKLKIGQTVGAIYTYTQPLFNVAAGLSNNRQNEQSEQAGDGLNESLRFNYTPIDGLKIGAGWEYVGNKAPSGIYDDSNYHNVNWVVDASYNKAPYGIEIDYGTTKKTVNGSAGDSQSALSVEAGYNVGPTLIYAGRVWDVNDSGFIKDYYTGPTTGMGKNTSLAQINNSFTVVGIAWPAKIYSKGMNIQLEYVRVDNTSTTSGVNSLGLRFDYEF